MNQHVAELAGVAAVWFPAVMLPGPNFLLIAKSSVKGEYRRGLGAAVGVSLGAALWSLASMLGLAILFKNYQWLYEVLKLLGGCWLIWLGFSTARKGFRPPPQEEYSAVKPVRRSGVAAGLTTSLSNPKTAAFFAGIFMTLLSPERPFWVSAAAVSVIFGISLLWYSRLAAAFGHARVRRGYHRIRRPLDVALGGLFCFLGFKLLGSE